LRIYQVHPLDYKKSIANSKSRKKYLKDGKPSEIGKLIFEKLVKHKVKDPYAPYSLEIKLKKYLQHPNKNLGQLLVSIEPTKAQHELLKKDKSWKQRDLRVLWVQSTNLG
jgi:hypothetical protein